MNGKTLYQETSYFRMFPDASDVFATRVKAHAQYLLPVATLQARQLSRRWEGEIHLVMPIEPCGGYGLLGENTEPYHNYLCQDNWVAYRMVGNKCELACDFRFFHHAYYAENPPEGEVEKQEAKELDTHYSQTVAEFTRHAQFFREHGWLCQSPGRWNGESMADWRVSLVTNLGGVSGGGNWSNSSSLPVSKSGDSGEGILPQTEDGRSFRYVGDVEMWHYIGDTNGVLVVFYDPKDRIVLTTVDWT